MSEWGKGVVNNNIGWGQGFNNPINWGAVYANSYNGQTVLSQVVNNIQTIINNFKTRVANDGGTFESESNLLSILTSVDTTIGLSKVNMLLTPNAFKAGKAYNVIGPTDFTVLRNTDATRVNSAGLIELQGSNIMRIDYRSGTPMILDEPQATNIFTNSNDFTAWNRNNVALNGVFFNDPSGVSIEGYDIATNGFLFKNYTADNVSTFTNSIFIRANKAATIQIRNCRNTNINIPVTTSFTKVSATAVSNQTSTLFVVDNRTTQVADLKLWFYQAQVELGSVPTSIIPTLASVLTRNDDLMTVTPPAGTVRITTTFLDNSTQVLNAIPATFTLPQGQIRRVVFQNSL